MDFMLWSDVHERVTPHVVRITTPRGSGTGFLVSTSADGSVCAVATAAHVIDDAHFWEQPIRLSHPSSGKSVLLRFADRAIFLGSNSDTAAIIFKNDELGKL